MKILGVFPSVPSAVKVRANNLLPLLARRHEIHMVCISSDAPSEDQKKTLRAYCENVVHVPHSKIRGLAQCLAALPTKMPLRIAYCRSKSAKDTVRRVYDEVQPDVLFVERWRTLQYAPQRTEAAIVCDPTDSMTLYNRRLMKAGAWWERLVGWQEYERFVRCEGQLARSADIAVFCSQVDMECVKEQAPDARCELVPNGVDCKKFFFKEEWEETPDTVIFTGGFQYRPNCHAVKMFLETIFPLIQREIPAVKFIVVGNRASRELPDCRSRKGIELIDFVPDLRPYLAKAAVAVAPMTVGAGVSNKVLEAFATGTPVVATPIPCGDLPVNNGEHLVIAEEAREFADHVVRLLKDAHSRREIALHARRLVEREYDLEIIAVKLEHVIREAVERKAKGKLAQMMTTE